MRRKNWRFPPSRKPAPPQAGCGCRQKSVFGRRLGRTRLRNPFSHPGWRQPARENGFSPRVEPNPPQKTVRERRLARTALENRFFTPGQPQPASENRFRPPVGANLPAKTVFPHLRKPFPPQNRLKPKSEVELANDRGSGRGARGGENSRRGKSSFPGVRFRRFPWRSVGRQIPNTRGCPVP